MLEQELKSWPSVSSRPMFGFLSFYHKKAIFAALPHTHAPNTPRSFMFRFESMPAKLFEQAKKCPKIDLSNRSPGAKWYLFEVKSAGDLRDALWWLNQAYEAVKKR